MWPFRSRRKRQDMSRIVSQRVIILRDGTKFYTGRVRFKKPLPYAKPTPSRLIVTGLNEQQD